MKLYFFFFVLAITSTKAMSQTSTSYSMAFSTNQKSTTVSEKYQLLICTYYAKQNTNTNRSCLVIYVLNRLNHFNNVTNNSQQLALSMRLLLKKPEILAIEILLFAQSCFKRMIGYGLKAPD